MYVINLNPTYLFLFGTDRDAVEKRLSILQEQGYVYSNTVNGNNSTWFILIIITLC